LQLPFEIFDPIREAKKHPAGYANIADENRQ
jgi:hypothetical protein